MQLPTLDFLRTSLDYDVKTGDLVWKSHKTRPYLIGKVAGAITREGYKVIYLAPRQYKAHRLAWLHFYGSEPNGMIDHINRNPSDNRIENLRICNASQNAANSRIRSNNTSGIRGVHWRPAHKKWVANIMVGGRYLYLGCFENKEDAAKAFQLAAPEFFGEFATAE